MARSLKRLNLSHNRIVSLAPLGEIADQSPLEVLDLIDNYIGELSHIKALQKFDNLKEVSFQKVGDESKGSNPICDFHNYSDTVTMFLHSVQKIDGASKNQHQSPSRNQNRDIGYLS